MRGILFGLLFGMIAASAVIYFAAGMQFQQGWARDTCSVVGRACDDPSMVYAATAVMAVLSLAARMIDSKN